MSEPLPDGAATEPAGEPNDQDPKPTDTVEFWKAKSREQEKRAKENADAARKLKTIEDAAKSETEKLSERLTVAEKRANDAELSALRLEVASSKGLNVSQARRLVGATKDELEKDADDLLSSFKPAKSSPDFDGGARTPAKTGDDMNQLIRRRARGG